MNQPIHSSHPTDAPGFSHSPGASIIWSEQGDGARPETILRMVLERVEHLQNQLPCEENEQVIQHLHEALHWEQVRNESRAAQGVQGTPEPHVSEIPKFEELPADEQPPPESAPPPPEPQQSEPPPPPPEQAHQPPNPDLEVTEEHTHPLDIAMPNQDGRFIPQAVLRGIEAQGIPYRLWVSTTFSNGEYAAARNHVKDFALQGNSPYILMTDNDLIFPPGAFQAMIMWLEQNPDFGMIAISKHGDPAPGNPNSVVEPGHIDAGPCMFRRDVYEKFTYSNKGGLCECGAMTNTLREDLTRDEHGQVLRIPEDIPRDSVSPDKIGVRCGFLTGWEVQHMRNTRLD